MTLPIHKSYLLVYTCIIVADRFVKKCVSAYRHTTSCEHGDACWDKVRKWECLRELCCQATRHSDVQVIAQMLCILPNS